MANAPVTYQNDPRRERLVNGRRYREAMERERVKSVITARQFASDRAARLAVFLFVGAVLLWAAIIAGGL